MAQVKWKQYYNEKVCTAEEAVQMVKSGDRVYIGTCSNIAYVLVDALAARTDELENVTICSGLTTQESPVFSDPRFHHMTYFMGGQERFSLKTGKLDYTSVHLSQFDLWAQKTARPNVLFIEVTPPDEGGYVNLSTNGTNLIPYMLDGAETIILQINSRVPHVCGEGTKIPVTIADAVVEAESAQHCLPEPEMDPSLKKLADQIVHEIPDGATIQLGAGRVACAVGYGLDSKNDLGIHTEMISDSLVRLMKNGNVTNRNKTLYPGKAITSFAWGTQELYDYLDYNDDIWFLPMTKANDPYLIAQNNTMISINGAASIDLFGQVSAEHINGMQYSGIGGQVDYVRGAQMSKGGKSFIVTESVYGDVQAGKGGSRIVSRLPAGAVVTTSRADVQYVATEYGCVNLKTLSMRERVKAMISLAHPAFRDQLAEEASRMGFV